MRGHNTFMQKDIRRRFARQLYRLRQHYNLTQEQLAERAGISTKYLQNLESKEPKKATIVTVEKLAKGLGIPVWKLLPFKE